MAKPPPQFMKKKAGKGPPSGKTEPDDTKANLPPWLKGKAKGKAKGK